MNKKTKTKWVVGSAVAAILTAFLILIIAISYPMISSRLYVTKAMKVLQGASAHASRSYQGAGVGGFVYQLKSPLAEAELKKCTEALGLTKYDSEQHGALSDPQVKDFVNDPLWWNEASGTKHYYFRNSLGERFVVRAKWENGQIYFLAMEPGSGRR